MNKVLSGIIALVTTLLAGSAHADHFHDCERPDYAKQYATKFGDKLDDGVKRADTLMRAHQKKVSLMRSALIQAGVWSENDADIFMKNIMQADEGRALEMERRSVGERLDAVMSSPAWKSAISAPASTVDHGICLHGPRVLEETELVFRTMEKVFQYKEAQIALMASEKNVALPVLD
ncbi:MULTISPECIES: hypothetical protein [unclassified Janthinobacterium]|uniref:hypothetical protein n=1 Tax=unclassified Janthinobacterium TaxID=2610881 RepID=UPI00161B77C3|nr:MULTISPECIES: hypothetical protein [unclassified Janthinobacterium]MBB5371520.1 hypothetical protein [Janthinobacterium sp. K2C7]MBB5384412.1 hypothetical protein [Janthinobacterium sp. K2Li3]MBB5389688.1 hypothetical protein [Janthinobacterium sp. K2E3]